MRPRFRSLLAATTVGFAFAIASCGSRTGLFAPDLTGIATVDAGVDAAPDSGLELVPCKPGTFTFELALTQLMFVVDRSGSMAFTLDGEPGTPRGDWRWTILRDGLRETILPFDQQIAMGAKFYPDPLQQSDLFDEQRSCGTAAGVTITPSKGNANAILQVFNDTTPRGGTPTSEAIRQTADFLVSTHRVARSIVLATDGAPNCNADLDPQTCVCTALVDCADRPERGRFSCLDDTRTVEQIRIANETQKIPVYVIGIGSTESPEFLDVLDAMAVAGGRGRAAAPHYYSVNSRADLGSALGSIRDSVAKCTYITPSVPNDPNNMQVVIGGAPIERDQLKQDGWDWIDKPYGELAFFGDACTKAEGAQAAVVAGTIACE